MVDSYMCCVNVSDYKFELTRTVVIWRNNMKIVFDNEWEKTRFVCDYCPGDIGLNDFSDHICPNSSDVDMCSRCWEAATTIEVAGDQTDKED